MKKRYYLLGLTMALLAVACTPEEENLFGDSSANRADAAIETTMELLAGASNGWLMEYYPEAMQQYGGYNLILSFDTKGSVKIASEIATPGYTTTSLYTVKQSAGILLSFDTYNNILHFFSDPSDPSGLGGRGFGLEGDYDFLVLEASAEKIVLKGKKSGGIAVLTPMESSDWDGFISDLQDADENMSFLKFKLELNGEDIPVSISNRTLTFTYEEDGDTKSQTASYIVTKTGYKFYSPIEIKGVTLSGFAFDAANNWFTETGNPSIKLIPIIPPLNEQFVGGDWYIAYSTLGAFAQIYFAACKASIDALGETLNYAFLGSSQAGTFSFSFDSSGYKGSLGYDYTLIDEDKVSLVFAFTGDNNGVWYHNNARFNYLLNPFGYSAARTFTLTTDNIARPSYITLTEDANPANVIKLHRGMVSDPFNK